VIYKANALSPTQLLYSHLWAIYRLSSYWNFEFRNWGEDNTWEMKTKMEEVSYEGSAYQ
jgi:hypothetical protein